ncbi:MAG: glycosyltransferase family 4 protein, partial [Planctomycetes bacterium]|nr:glycosyltransferase family 4 protein [Planctomycetota bacterium]
MSTDRMTILQVLPALESGGVERGVLEVASAIVQAGHRSLVVSAPGRMVAELVQQGSEHFACPIGIKSPWTLRWVPWLRRLLGREKVDVIDIHSRLPGWIAWMAWKSLPDSRRPRFLSSVHGLHSVSRYSEIMCSGELVIVVSKMVQDYVTSNYPRIPVERLRLIHRGIDSREYPRGFISSDQWKSDFFGQYPRLTNQPIIT